MDNKDIVIVSTGMVTSVGFNSAQTAANVRAKVARFQGISFVNESSDPFVAATIARDFLGELPEAIAHRDYFTRRRGLLLRLAGVALRDCLAVIRGRVVKPPLFYAIPEYENTQPINGDSLLDDLATLHPGVFDRTESKVSGRGRAGGLQALGEAIRTVQSRKTDFALVGASDSYVDMTILLTLDWYKRCKHESHPDSFVPGEGAGFLLICSREAAQKAGLEIIANVGPVAEGQEPGYWWWLDEPYLGEGLASTVQALLAAGAPPSPFKEVYSTMNGESYWAKEWGVTRIRNADAFAEKENMNHPAEFYGDPGAASGLLLVALAAIGQKKGYVESPALVYASSDFGGRAATWVASTKS